MNDDAFVILRGNIKQNVGDDIYVFTDGTGSINVYTIAKADVKQAQARGFALLPQNER